MQNVSSLIASQPQLDAMFRALFCPDAEVADRARMLQQIEHARANDRCILIPCHHGLLTECAACIAETAEAC